jgi:hypothetical protein
MATAQLELIFAQIKPLPMNDKLRLLQWVAEDLQPVVPAREPAGLIYGKYHDTGRRLSTEEDFKLAEWQPTEAELNGE